MEKLIVLTKEEMVEISGGGILPKDFKGKWWCVYCWIDYLSKD